MADGRYEQVLMTNTSSNTNASTNTNMYTYKYKHGFYCNKHGKIVNYDKYKYNQTLMGGRNFSYCWLLPHSKLHQAVDSKKPLFVLWEKMANKEQNRTPCLAIAYMLLPMPGSMLLPMTWTMPADYAVAEKYACNVRSSARRHIGQMLLWSRTNTKRERMIKDEFTSCPNWTEAFVPAEV